MHAINSGYDNQFKRAVLTYWRLSKDLRHIKILIYIVVLFYYDFNN